MINEKEKKIIFISNRLPVTANIVNKKIILIPSSGGLATGLSSLSKKFNCLWVGFSGIPSNTATPAQNDFIKLELEKKYNSIPVNLTNHELKLYYNNFCNKTIWPLFHYFPYFTEYDLNSYEMYKTINYKFFDEFSKVFDGNIETCIWIQDYHLMILPQIIRNKFPKAKIGFFLHIPFPSFEIFRLLPWKKQIIEGLLGADLIGFHTYRYVTYFLNCALQIKGLENKFGIINTGERIIKADAFPMGIDYEKFNKCVRSPKIKKEINLITKQTGNSKVVISIDRLDYTKGILKRLEAVDLFLTKYPEYKEKIIFIMVSVPSRTDLDSYKSLKSRVDETVGRINGKYSIAGWNPIWYMYRSIEFEQVAALYSVSDTALVTPIRDGMNLVAKEYIAAQHKKTGVLIVSEMAGVADELSEAIIVNPNDIQEIADSIHLSLTMPFSEKKERLLLMSSRLKKYNIFKWANEFIEKLSVTDEIQKQADEKFFSNINLKVLFNKFKISEKRIFFLDYDGTLSPFKNKPSEASPDKELYNILNNLASDPKNEIVIISGRDKDTLGKWFDEINAILVAEHGIWLKYKNKKWKTLFNLDTKWKKFVYPILEKYTDRTPGTFIEEKNYSLAWHYRKADIQYAIERLGELKAELFSGIANLNLGIIDGNKVIEIKSLDINKGRTALRILNQRKYDFICAIGDDATDEDMFEHLPRKTATFKVGIGATKAKFYFNSYIEVRNFLTQITTV